MLEVNSWVLVQVVTIIIKSIYMQTIIVLLLTSQNWHQLSEQSHLPSASIHA